MTNLILSINYMDKNYKIKNKLTTEYYKVLEILCENEIINSNGEKFVPITQNEIAKTLNLHKMTVNSIFKELRNDGLITQAEHKKGIYFLSDNAVKIYKSIKKIKF